MFQVNDIVKFTDKRSSSKSSWKVMSDCKADVYELKDITKDGNIRLVALGEWLIYDQLYYRKLKLKKICSKLGML